VLVLTSKNIKDIIISEIGCKSSIIHTPDTFYNLMTESFIDEVCYPEFKKWLTDNNIVKWDKAFDCDNYAESMRNFVQVIHINNANTVIERQSLWSSAFGVIWYKRKTGGHAINVQITIRSGKYVIRYIEPQSGEEVQLTPEEIRSIFFILI